MYFAFRHLMIYKLSTGEQAASRSEYIVGVMNKSMEEAGFDAAQLGLFFILFV